MKKVIGILIIILGVIIFLWIKSNTMDESRKLIEQGEQKEMSKITITINNKNFTATLENNETTKELVKELPIEITMSELNGNEKYYYMSSSLPTDSKRVGKIKTGDIMLYGSDYLVIFYDSFSTPYSYTRIGKIDNPDSLKSVVGKKSIEVTINK